MMSHNSRLNDVTQQWMMSHNTDDDGTQDKGTCTDSVNSHSFLPLPIRAATEDDVTQQWMAVAVDDVTQQQVG